MGRKWFPESEEPEKNEKSKERIQFLKKLIRNFKTTNNEEKIGVLGLVDVGDREGRRRKRKRSH